MKIDRRALITAALLSSGCAGLFGRGAPSEALVLDRTSAAVLTDARNVELRLRNRGSTTLEVPRPSPSFLLVHAQTDRGRVLPCETAAELPETIELVELAPGSELTVRVDFTARCALDASTQFVGDVKYSVPEGVRSVPGGANSWTGVTRPARLQVAPSADLTPRTKSVAPIEPAREP